MNRHNHPAPFGFVVLNQRGLDGLWIEGKSLLAVAAFQKFPGAGKWSRDRIITKGTKYILLLVEGSSPS
jgi:hypothetical protein